MQEAGHSKLVLWDNPKRWDGEGTRRVFQDGGTHVHSSVIHADVWQNYHNIVKKIIFQLKWIKLKINIIKWN